MFAIRIEYPMGRVYASQFNDRSTPEWPPHPARLFSALVATWAEDGADADSEQRALEWLESQPAPAIACAPHAPRTTATHYVPVNDARMLSGQAVTAGGMKAALELLPEHRVRQPRQFPSAWIESPVVHFIWPDAEPADHAAALRGLLGRLVRVGHSSSLVIGAVVDQAPEPTLQPADEGEVLRVVAPGQLLRLTEDFRRHRGEEPRVLPFRVQRYAAFQRASNHPAPRSHFSGDWLLLRRSGGARVNLTQSVRVALAVRGALMRYSDQPPTALVSGHQLDGSPARDAHLAIVALPHVGHRHADGALLGVALLVPNTAEAGDRHALNVAIARWEAAARSQQGLPDDEDVALAIGLGDRLELEFERVRLDPGAVRALHARTWSGPAIEWMSVTPVALDRNPGDMNARDPAREKAAFAAAAESIALGCTRIGLPQPASVTIMPSGTWAGGAKARAFPPFPSDPSKQRRVKVHARIRFSEPVVGPIVIGAGRFQGLGLFRPADVEA